MQRKGFAAVRCVLVYPVTIAKDPYAILGISQNASQDDIKSAYRRLSKEWHPDKHKGDKAAEDHFKEINEAYEILGNPERRTQYDRFGWAGGRAGAGNGANGFDFNGFDFSSFGSAGDFGDVFESFFGGGRKKAARAEGADREVEVHIGLAEVLKGEHATIGVRRMVACPECHGSGARPNSEIVTCKECGGTGQITHTVNSFFGRIQQRAVCSTCGGSGSVPKEPCPECKGEGRVQETSRITVDIPPGIEDGQTLRVRGQGDAGRRGGNAGDLFVHIRVTPDQRFTRNGADIRSTVSVSVVDALLGGTTEIDTVQGTSVVQIPEGMQPGQVFRLRGKGLPVLGSSRFGDHYVTLQVEIPKKLSRKERKILEEWRKERG